MPSENRKPTFPSTETGQRSIDENTRAGQNIGDPVAADDPERNRLTYSLGGADAGAFTIVSSTGQLRTQSALDYETKSSYSVTVEVHDGLDGAGNSSTDIDSTKPVTIAVGNVEEPGTVTLTSLTQSIQARVQVTATLADDDGPTAGTINWQWSRSPNGHTGWVSIADANNPSYVPTDTDEGNYIRATASYTDGHGSGKTAQKISPRVGAPPPVNSAPAFPATESGRREIPENTAGGIAVGAPLTANDINNDALIYSITGTDASAFVIDAATGQLSVAADAMLDYEGRRTYRVTVQVTDGRDENGDDDSGAIDATISVTISVTDVNEAPVVSGEASPSFAENGRSAIATYRAADPERDTVSWTVSGTDAGDFRITGSGQLHFAAPPSFEDDATYSVTVTATDDDATDPLSGTLDVTVTVTDVEEEG